MRDNFFKRNKAARVITVILLMIPAIVAAIFAFNVDPTEVSKAALETVTVSHEGLSKTYSDEETLKLYSEISKDAIEIDASFRDFTQEIPFDITFTESDGSVVTYSLYMLNDQNDCMFKNSEGKFFKMDAEIAKSLLLRDEFTGVNSDSFLPVVNFERNGVKYELSPDVYTWSYKNVDGGFETSEGSRMAQNPVIKFTAANTGSLLFDKTPDSVKVTLKNGSETVFDDTFENLSAALSYTSDTYLDMTLVCEWYEIEGAEFFGKLTYNLKFLYDITPTVELVDDHALPQGDFTVIRFKNFNDGENVKLSSDYDLPESTRVFTIKEENIKFAFIPLPSDTAVGKHDVTITTEDAHESKVTVSVRESAQKYQDKTVIVANPELQGAFTSDGFEQWENTLQNAINQSKDEQMWEGKFAYPTNSSKLVAGGFDYGTKLDIKSLYTKAYTSFGMALNATAGQSVKASNKGEVVFADALTLTGNTVIIDHGYGVLSIYGNLSEISVKTGDTVTKETIVGKAGSTGFASDTAGNVKTQVTFAVNIGGRFIDARSVCKYGIKLKDT